MNSDVLASILRQRIVLVMLRKRLVPMIFLIVPTSLFSQLNDSCTCNYMYILKILLAGHMVQQDFLERRILFLSSLDISVDHRG